MSRLQDVNNKTGASGPKDPRAPTILDPDAIEALAKSDPMTAAFECRKDFARFETGYQKDLRRRLANPYLIAFTLKANETLLEKFSFNYYVLGFVQKQDIEKTRERLIFQVMQFVLSGTAATYNRICSYGYSLEHQLHKNVDPERVKELLIEHGPERLYRAALERKKLTAAAAKYQEAGHDLTKPINESYLLPDYGEEDRARFAGPGVAELDAEEAVLSSPTVGDTDEADSEDSGRLLDEQGDDEAAADGQMGSRQLERKRLQAAEERVAELASMVRKLEVGLSSLTHIIRSL